MAGRETIQNLQGVKEPALGVGLDALFNPKGLAIIGASNDANRIGGRPIDFMRRGGYRGSVYPVNPGRDEVQGLPAVGSIRDIAGEVELSVVAVPAKLVGQAVDDSIARGVKAITVFTSGFAEIGEEGAREQQIIRDKCRAAGVRLLGPNCLGLMNVRSGMFLTFSTVIDAVPLRAGPVAVVTQSGAFGAYFCGLAAQRGIGLSQYVATGNEADIDTSDCIAWLAGDPETSVIVVYIEGCRSGGRLRAALRLAVAAGKQVLFYKAGSSAAGAAAANSHTGSLAGSDIVWDAVLAEAGAHRFRSIRSLLNAAYALSRGEVLKDRSVGIISGSGGVGIALADAMSDAGLDVRPMPAAAQAEIMAMNPFAAAVNPVDTTAQVLNDMSLFGRMLTTMLRDGDYAIITVFLMQYAFDPVFFASWKKALLEAKQAFPGRQFALCMSGPEAELRFLEQQGFLIFEDPAEAATALALLARDLPPLPPPVAAHAIATPERITLDENRSRAVLEQLGIPFAPQRAVRDVENAVAAAGELGYPVVLKILSPDIAHKSEVGGVEVGLADEAAVRMAWNKIATNVAKHAPQAIMEGMLVAKMIRGGVETILGIHVDQTFGPLVMFGLGGIAVELYADVVFRPVPIDHAEAERMIRSIRGFPMLDGFRGRPRADLDVLCDALVKLSRWADRDRTVISAEINPFLALPDGGAALDALIVRSPTA